MLEKSISVELLDVTPLLNYLLLCYQCVCKRFLLLLFFLFHQLLRVDVASGSFALRLGVEDLGDRFLTSLGISYWFPNAVSTRRKNWYHQCVNVEKADSNSGAETRQGQEKKGSGRWNRDRNTAGCHSGTWTKILYRVTRQGEGQRGPLGKKNLQICCLCNCWSYFQWLLSPKLETLCWF